MSILNQEKAPLYEALKAYKNKRVVPFDVPGHKHGTGNKLLTEFLGQSCMSVDVNGMKPLDFLNHPVSVIKEAEELAAEAFKADYAYFMVGGTSSSVQAMILSCCKRGEKIIMPRNVHISAINALIISGCIPVYVNPSANNELGIQLGMAIEDVKTAIREHPDAKAVFVNNPTYYGICSALSEIVTLAHEANMLVLADEAHGTHFYFGEQLPDAAMHVGADMACVSMHKTGGSLTQSSLLLINSQRVNYNYVRTIINLTQTTSASYLLMSSLDIARMQLATDGVEIFKKVSDFANYARDEINKIGGYYAFSSELINGNDIANFDITKLSINTLGVGLAGVEVYDILRDDYDIQIEFGDISNILCIISVGDTIANIERLIAALADIKRIHSGEPRPSFLLEYIDPIVRTSPNEAFFSQSTTTDLQSSAGRISAEFVMCYPPGIPILSPGELITTQILEYIAYAKRKGSLLTGFEDLTLRTIKVLK